MVWRGPNMERVRIAWSVGGYQEAAQKGSAEEPQLNHRHKPASTTCVALTIFPYLAFRTFLFNSSPRLCYISNSPSNILTITSTSFPSALVPSRLHSHSLGTHANTHKHVFFYLGIPIRYRSSRACELRQTRGEPFFYRWWPLGGRESTSPPSTSSRGSGTRWILSRCQTRVSCEIRVVHALASEKTWRFSGVRATEVWVLGWVRKASPLYQLLYLFYLQEFM